MSPHINIFFTKSKYAGICVLILTCILQSISFFPTAFAATKEAPEYLGGIDARGTVNTGTGSATPAGGITSEPVFIDGDYL